MRWDVIRYGTVWCDVSQEIDPEMVEVHRFVVDKYAQKFPGLDSLIPQPADYVKTVQVMRNEMVGPSRACGRVARGLILSVLFFFVVALGGIG